LEIQKLKRGWLSQLQKDKKMIIRAAAKAQKAVDHILRHDEGGENAQ
jgi:antirestriction protein ArdC